MYTKRSTSFVKVCFFIIFVFLAITASPISAEEEQEPQGLPVTESLFMEDQDKVNTTDGETTIMDSSPVKMFALLVKTGASLILIAVLIFGLVRFLARSRMRPKGGLFQVFGGVSLGPNKSLQLVKVGDSLYLLGVGDNIQLIRHIDGPEAYKLLSQMEEMASSELQAGFRAQIGKFLPRSWRNKLKLEQTTGMDNSFQYLLKEKLGEVQKKSRESRQMMWDSTDGEERDSKW